MTTAEQAIFEAAVDRYNLAAIVLGGTAAIVAALGVVVVFGGIFAFLNFREIAKRQAKESAEEIAEAMTNDYIQRQMPVMIEAYLDLMMPEDDDDEDEDEDTSNDLAASEDD